MQFNGLDLKIISSKEYEEELKSVSGIPVWIDPISIRIYENKEIIKILLDNKPLAYYVVPFYYKDGKKWAERKYRYFAYLSPFFVKKCPNKKRKEAIYLIFNYIFEKNKTSELLSTRKIGGDRSGTGDVFSSIVTGALIQGQDFKTAVKRAVTFLDKAIAYTAQMELPWNYGICFEEYLEEI